MLLLVIPFILKYVLSSFIVTIAFDTFINCVSIFLLISNSQYTKLSPLNPLLVTTNLGNRRVVTDRLILVLVDYLINHILINFDECFGKGRNGTTIINMS